MSPTNLYLVEAEKRLIEAARQGDVAEYTADEPRTIRAEIVVALATGQQEDWTANFRGIRIKGARIEGKLDFTGARLNVPLEILDCELTETLVLANAETRTIRLTGSRVPGIQASRASIQGGLALNRGFHCKGEIRLRDARIEGTLDADGATFENPGGSSFDGNRMSISGNLYLGQEEHGGFCSIGKFSIVLARFGVLGGDDAVFDNLEGDALDATGLNTRGPVLLRKATVRGTIRLLYADIGMTLECDKASFSTPGKKSLWADGLKTGSNVFLRDGFHSQGEISLLSAQIGGHFDCSNAELENPEGISLNATGTHTRGAINLGKAHARGAVSLGLAHAALLYADDAILEGHRKMALNAEGITLKGPAWLRRLQAQGQVTFMYARVETSVELDGADLKNTGDLALSLEGLITRGPVLLRDDFRSAGRTNLLGADIGGNLELSSAHFEGEVNLTRASVKGDLLCHQSTFLGLKEHALTAAGLHVEGSLDWRDLPAPPQGPVILSGASAGRLVDDMKSWPDEIRIDNFTYGSFEQGAPLTSERLGWLRRQKEFSPQPYEQVVHVLRRMGYEKDARRIARAKQDDLRTKGNLGWPARLWNLFLSLTIGHGYQVWRALLFLLAVITLGAFVFNAAYDDGVMVSTKPSSLQAPPKFEPLVYSIDVCLPILDLHQERYWTPLKRDPAGFWYRFYFWAHIAAGWIVTTVAVTGLTGLVKKD